jgi:hypothetical protein
MWRSLESCPTSLCHVILCASSSVVSKIIQPRLVKTKVSPSFRRVVLVLATGSLGQSRHDLQARKIAIGGLA